MADYPSIVYRYPTSATGPVPDIRPSIIFDWSTDIVSTQFSNSQQLAQFFVLFEKDNGLTIPTSFSSYDPTQRRVTIVPAQDLLRNTTYVVLVNDKVLDTFGRKSVQQSRWEFTTSVAAVPQVIGLTPPDSIVLPVFPNLGWSSVPTSGSINYEIELDRTFDFVTPIYNQFYSTVNPASGGSGTYSITPVGSFSPNTTYYWRVRALSPTASGQWSDTFSFYFGDVRVADPGSLTTPNVPPVFTIAPPGFDNGASNQNNWPSPISINFTYPVSGDPGLTLIAKSLYPRNDVRSSYVDQTVAGLWVPSNGNQTFTFYPSGGIQNNTRYELDLSPNILGTNGYTLGDGVTYYFTGPYDPYYVSSRAIRARFLSAEQQIPEDLINWFIYTTSLEAKVRFYGFSLAPAWVTYMGDSLKEPMIRDTRDLDSFGVLKWVEAATTYNLIKAILREEMRNVGRSRQLGNYQESLDANFLKALEMAKNDAKEELEMYQNYLIASDIPMSAAKSSWYSDYNMDTDLSIYNLARRTQWYGGSRW